MDLTKSTRLRLEQERNSLLREFQSWRDRSAHGDEYAKHNTQIRAITTEIEAFLQAIDTLLLNVSDPLELCDVLCNSLLYANHVWAFYRTRLLQRSVDCFRDALSCADEFAWECYTPARIRAEQAGVAPTYCWREPPLSFFDNDSAPYIAQRKAIFTPDGVSKRWDSFKAFRGVLETLPVPLIAMPWLKVNHLPSYVVIAHEIGHLVERDFELSGQYKLRIQGLYPGSETSSNWISWSSELFADVYATLCSGPAYALALVEFLFASRQTIQRECTANFPLTPYPPRSLRVAFIVEALEQCGLEHEGVTEFWKGAYGVECSPDLKKRYAEVPAVVQILLTTPLFAFGNVPITDIVRISSCQWDKLQKKAATLLRQSRNGGNLPLEGESPDPFRRWFATATLAYHSNAQAFADQDTHSYLLKKLRTLIAGTTRDAASINTSGRHGDVGQTLLSHFLEYQ